MNLCLTFPAPRDKASNTHYDSLSYTNFPQTAEEVPATVPPIFFLGAPKDTPISSAFERSFCSPVPAPTASCIPQGLVGHSVTQTLQSPTIPQHNKGLALCICSNKQRHFSFASWSPAGFCSTSCTLSTVFSPCPGGPSPGGC